MSIMNTQQIMDILPHRSPFLLIDTVEELEPGVKCVAKKNVTMNEPHFMGHFPGNPVMPGVLIIEALAQTGAVAILCQDEWKGKTAYFAGINNAKFCRCGRGSGLRFPVPAGYRRIANTAVTWQHRQGLRCHHR